MGSSSYYRKYSNFLSIIKRFIEAKPRYPRINRIKYLAEHKMSTKNYLLITLFNGLKNIPI